MLKLSFFVGCIFLLWTSEAILAESATESAETPSRVASALVDDLSNVILAENVDLRDSHADQRITDNEDIVREEEVQSPSEIEDGVDTQSYVDKYETPSENLSPENGLNQEDIQIASIKRSGGESAIRDKSPVSKADEIMEAVDEELELLTPESFMGIVAPTLPKNEDVSATDSENDPEDASLAQEESSADPKESESNAKKYLLSYQTFLAWFIEKIRPETESDFGSPDSGSSDSSNSPQREEESSKKPSVTPMDNSASESSNETTEDSAGKSASPNSSSTPAAPVEGAAEQNETSKCSGFGCILKLNQKAKTIKCAPRNMTTLERKREGATLDDLTRVHIFQSQGRITEALKHRKPEQGDCILLLVFSPHCRFSVKIAPHVNALARAFPLLEVGAVDALLHRGIAHKFGVAGVPSLVLFQNNKMVAKLNDTEGIDTSDFREIVKSVSSMTGLSANESVGVEDSDYEGPLKSDLVEEVDIYLVWSWAFLIFFAIQKFLRSDWGRSIRQSLLLHLTIWREVAENGGRNDPQLHPHAD